MGKYILLLTHPPGVLARTLASSGIHGHTLAPVPPAELGGFANHAFAPQGKQLR